MQFTMKNVFALAAIVGSVVASPAQVPSTNIRARDILNKLSQFIDAGINIPADYKPFNGSSGLRPAGEVAIVTSEDEAIAFSEHHGHQVRIDAFQGELIYVKVGSESEDLQHVGTLRGPYLDQTLGKIEHYLQQQELKALTAGTSPAAPAADAELQNKAGEKRCSLTWCAISWQCIYYDRNCGGCVIFWCT